MPDRQTIDSFLLLFTFLASFGYLYFLIQRGLFRLKKGYAFMLVFLPLYTFLNMVVHLIAVTAVALVRAKVGAFEYDLRFYTLIQFGVILAGINWYLLNKVNQISRGNWMPYRNMIKATGLQILITLPLVPFNPISLLPAITSILLMGVLYLEYRRRFNDSKREINPEVINKELAAKQLA